jgi:hypothetical protein
MTWPANTITEGSAGAAWSRICNDAFAARRTASGLIASAEAGTLTMGALRNSAQAFRGYRQTLNQLSDTPGLQQYGRLVSGVPTFDLAVEGAALLSAYTGVIAALRALHNSLADSIGAGGDVVLSPTAGIDPALCTALITALRSVETAITPTPGALP